MGEGRQPLSLQRDPGSFRYLSLEGGGGKGIAYLGALAALSLEEFPFFRSLKGARPADYQLDPEAVDGLAGTSAGAITAALLATGTTLGELTQFSLRADLLRAFFDLPDTGLIPVFRTRRTNRNAVPDADEYCVPNESTAAPSRSHSDQVFDGLIDRMSSDLLWSLTTGLTWYFAATPPEVINRLVNDADAYLESLTADLGLFSGCNVRTTIDYLLARRIKDADGSGVFGARFEDLASHPRLRLFGTRLEDGRSTSFSLEATPSMRLVDAIYVSMCLPFLFKPLRIALEQIPEDLPDYLAGTWVDGGVLNNNPIHAFDDPAGGPLRSDMLGLRLGLEGAHNVNDLGRLTVSLLGAVLGLSEQAQIRTQAERDQLIHLPVGDLSTAQFTPPLTDVYPVVDAAARATLKFFGVPERDLSRGAALALSRLAPFGLRKGGMDAAIVTPFSKELSALVRIIGKRSRTGSSSKKAPSEPPPWVPGLGGF